MHDLALWLESLPHTVGGSASIPALYVASFVVCILSGFLPFVNAEAYLLALSTVAPAEHAVPLTATATLGQMVAKSVLFYGGRGAIRVRAVARWKGRIDQAHERVMSWPGGTGVALFASASVGIPPFYAVSVVAGTLGIPFGRFAVIGFLGRFLRFGSVYAIPLLVRSFYS
jgi:membrane protein YqaA with SNARE-associated domain